jgi:hypothetical protein
MTSHRAMIVTAQAGTCTSAAERLWSTRCLDNENL